eukprot:Tbor_TRINITY_DN2044_c0_g1::TRINITY_DN2044_c0_g1_i1::g.12190::m.12190
MMRHQLLSAFPVLASSPKSFSNFPNTITILRLNCPHKLLISHAWCSMRHCSTSPYNFSEELRQKELEAEKVLRVEASRGLREKKVNLTLYGNCAKGGTGTVGSSASTSSPGSEEVNSILGRLPRNRTEILVLLCGILLSIYSAKILYDRFTGRSKMNQEHVTPVPMWLATHDIRARYLLFSAISTEDERKNIYDEYQLAKSSGLIHPMIPFYTWLDAAHPTWCRGIRYSPQQVVDCALFAAKEMSGYRMGELSVLLSSIRDNKPLSNGNPNHRMELVDSFVDKCQNLGKGSSGGFLGSFFSSPLDSGSSSKKEPDQPPFAPPALRPQFVPAPYIPTAVPTDIPLQFPMPSIEGNKTISGDTFMGAPGVAISGSGNTSSVESLMGTQEISLKDVVGEVVEQRAAVDPLARVRT